MVKRKRKEPEPWDYEYEMSKFRSRAAEKTAEIDYPSAGRLTIIKKKIKSCKKKPTCRRKLTRLMKEKV